MAEEGYDWLHSYWYVPDAYLPALQAVNVDPSHVRTLVDQTVWFFQHSRAGYLVGTSATNIGSGWSYMLVVGSVAPGGAVKLSFSPLGSAGGGNPPPPTIGDGVLLEDDCGAAFLMQMTSGTTAMNVTHWAYMRRSRATILNGRRCPAIPTRAFATSRPCTRRSPSREGIGRRPCEPRASARRSAIARPSSRRRSSGSERLSPGAAG